jgi:hypothetical protein
MCKALYTCGRITYSFAHVFSGFYNAFGSEIPTLASSSPAKSSQGVEETRDQDPEALDVERHATVLQVILHKVCFARLAFVPPVDQKKSIKMINDQRSTDLYYLTWRNF